MPEKRRSLLRHHDFVQLWTAETISQIGSQVSLLALPLVAAALLALASFDVAVPGGMVKIPGGTFAYGTDSAALVTLMAQYHVSDPAVLGPEAPQRNPGNNEFVGSPQRGREG